MPKDFLTIETLNNTLARLQESAKNFEHQDYKTIKCLICGEDEFICFKAENRNQYTVQIVNCPNISNTWISLENPCQHCRPINNFAWFIHEKCIEAYKIAPDNRNLLSQKILVEDLF